MQVTCNKGALDVLHLNAAKRQTQERFAEALQSAA